MHDDIFEYIKKDVLERKMHLNLSDSCVEIGGNSQQFRGLLAHYLKTTIPRGMKIVLCHACNNDKCSNVRHLYWGTAKENVNDQILRGTHKSIWQRTVEKYGEEKARKLSGIGNRFNGGKARWEKYPNIPIHTNKGKIAINDGIVIKYWNPNENLPEGFIKGRLVQKVERRTHNS